MSAQIRPNRMEVTDRFPMLGFSVRVDEPNVNAEVVLATHTDLFYQHNSASRTAANFYSSREHGMLTVPRGEGVFVVPPEVLARFIGSDQLYFGLATGRANNGGLHTDAVPREGSPYVSLRGFTGRTLRRSFGSGREITRPVLEWTGDTARPGSESANGGAARHANGNGNPPSGTNGANAVTGYGNGNGAVVSSGQSTEYNDGFGPMPVLPGDQRARARRIGGAFSDRIGEALDLGLPTQTVDPLLALLDAHAPPVTMPTAPTAMARSKSFRNEGRQPRSSGARGMGGGADAATAIGGFLLETLRDSKGDVSWELEQFRGLKHPNDAAPANPAPFRDAATINFDDWPVWEGIVDDISASFKVDWQYNGLSLGNVRITNIGTNDAIGFSLHVTAKIMDDQRLHPPSNCAALRITFHYHFDRSVGSEGIAIREVTLYGDGTYETSKRWQQASALSAEQRQRQAPASAQGARGMDGGVSAAIAIGGFLLETLRDSKGDVSWELEQFRGLKHPNDAAPANPAPFRDAATINFDDWPVWEGIVDDISASFKVDWQYNGLSLGNVRITNIGTNDAIGFSLHVTAKIMDDQRLHPPSNCAALRITFHYHFDRSVGSEGIAIRDVTLYGDGTYETSKRWQQASALSAGQRQRQPRSTSSKAAQVRHAPPARARGLGAGADAATAIGGFLLETLRDSKGDISWELEQFRGLKHPNDAAPANPAPFRDAPTINFDDWPVWEGIVDDISASFKVDWQYNGLSLGNVRITNIGTNDAIGFSLRVTAKIMDDQRLHPPTNCAALRITFHYHFDRSVGSEGIAIRDVTLYGDGTYETSGRWQQASALSAGQRTQYAHA